ncbi:1,4-alpha-glucan branching protein [Streptomyces sp. NPDC005963]|uniref:maltokinase N-terminal cap-like domain-containing protein n=1 Tax=Streptomyces sp. NPDC005963 TaxID=3156721 RepID=UPI0033E8804F
MAVIHHTVLEPTKLELLAHWLPSRPWYRGNSDEMKLAKAGGFRLDDPKGEVGIEFMVVTDTSGLQPTSYLVPLTYRGAPLEGAEDALVGTMEHGVLGRRWAYDGCHDPVAVTQLLALIEGSVQAQDQNISDTLDRELVVHSCTAEDPVSQDPASQDLVSENPVSEGPNATVSDDDAGTELSWQSGRTLRLHRILRPVTDGPSSPTHEANGSVTGPWQLPDGTRAHGPFAVLHHEHRP